jgi:hypothetical protein
MQSQESLPGSSGTTDTLRARQPAANPHIHEIAIAGAELSTPHPHQHAAGCALMPTRRGAESSNSGVVGVIRDVALTSRQIPAWLDLGGSAADLRRGSACN